jgi:hypothetical protein
MYRPGRGGRWLPPNPKKLLEEILEVEHEALCDLKKEALRILEHFEHCGQNRYKIRLTLENNMLGKIAPGSTGQFGAVLLNNGAPDTSGFTPSFTFTASDPSATFAPATTDASNGTIPLEQQTVLSIPEGDTLGSVTVTATCVDPNGVSQSTAVTVEIGAGPAPAVYSVGLTQLA